jgi:hypothetical protein
MPTKTRTTAIKREDETKVIQYRAFRLILISLVAVITFATIYQIIAWQLSWLDIVSILCVCLPYYLTYHRNPHEMTLGLYIAVIVPAILLLLTTILVMANYGILPFKQSNFSASQR